MNTHDIELPPLPEARIVSYQTDSTMRRMELRTYSDKDMRDYARAAIEPYQRRIAELESQIEAIGAGGVTQGQRLVEADSQRRGEPVVLATYHAIIDESEKHIMHDTRTKQLEIYDEREDAVKAAPDHLSVVPVYVTATEGPLFAAPQPAVSSRGEPVAWRVHPFDYGIGHEGVYALTSRPDQVAAWERKGWEVQPLYTAPQPAEPVKVNAIFETENGEVIGTTDAKVKRVEWQDDGSLTVVIDYWPQPDEPDEWKLAVDHELTNIHSTADSYSSAKDAVKALIDWHVAVATDPVFQQPAVPSSKDSDDFFTNDNPKLRGLNEPVKDEQGYCNLDLACEGGSSCDACRPSEPVKTPSDDDSLTIAYMSGYHDGKRSATPEGWQLVPKEPTKEMLAATSWPNCAGTDYKHMLAAAPKFGEEK